MTSPSPRVAARVSTPATRLAGLGFARARFADATDRATGWLWGFCGDLEDRSWCLRHLHFLASCVSAGRRADADGLRRWPGAGSNRRPSAFQVNRAKRYADLRKRTSPTSETALGGRCEIHASRHQVPRPSGSTATIHAARLVDGHRPDVVATIAGRVALEDRGFTHHHARHRPGLTCAATTAAAFLASRTARRCRGRNVRARRL